MPTTVVEFDQRVYESEGYDPRLRRPVFLEALVRGRRATPAPPGQLIRGRRAPSHAPPPSKSARIWGRMMPLRGLGASPCPAGYMFRQTGSRCFCDPELQGLSGLGEEITCPRAAVVAQERPAYTVYRAPRAETLPLPEDSPELVVPNDEGAAVEPDLPAEGPTIPLRKQTPPWVWYAGAGGGGLVIFWLLFRRKRKG
jgi:hypothetical protein